MPGEYYEHRKKSIKSPKQMEFRAWTKIHQRRKRKGYRICARWNRFEEFLKDMGSIPGDNHYVKRIDENLEFCGSNCCWEPLSEEQVEDKLRQKQEQELKKKNKEEA